MYMPECLVTMSHTYTAGSRLGHHNLTHLLDNKPALQWMTKSRSNKVLIELKPEFLLRSVNSLEPYSIPFPLIPDIHTGTFTVLFIMVPLFFPAMQGDFS